MVENKHKVPNDWWNKLDDQAKQLFNDVYEDIMKVGPHLFLHPDTLANYDMPTREWATVAWNAAWTATACLKKPNSSVSENKASKNKVYRD